MTTTFGTITNIQFVANRSNGKETSCNVNKAGGSRTPSSCFCKTNGSVNCNDHLAHFGNGHPSPINNNFCSPTYCEYPNSNLINANNILTGSRTPGNNNSPITNISPGSSQAFCSRPPSSLSSLFSPSAKVTEDIGGTTGLAVEESPSGSLRFATDRPHLVSMGGGRLSISVTLHPINEGKTILGSGGMGVVPDIPVLGTGVEPEHCLLEHKDGIVSLTPLAPMVAVDGLRISSTTRLTQGCMICLGRSNFFRFNHPAEAKLMRSILPNARISMAPIAFYPAVDNPEYFHMTAQEAGVGEGARVGGESPSREETRETKPPVPPRRTPPSTLSLTRKEDPSNDYNENFDIEVTPEVLSGGDDIIEQSNFFNNKMHNLGESDSDDPPEVPPRSEGNCSSYVNSPTASVAMGTSANYIGEYIYTKSEVEPSVVRVLPGTTRVVGGAATVVSPNGMTTVHNALYRSLPASSCSTAHNPTASSPVISNSPPSFPNQTLNPSYHSPVIIDNHTSLPKLNPISVGLNSSFANSQTKDVSSLDFSSIQSADTSQYASPNIHSPLPAGADYAHFRLTSSSRSPNHTTSLGLKSPLKTSTEDLRNTEMKKLQAIEDRVKEQEEAAAEKARLEEILTMCAEYERQQKGEYVGGTTTPTKSQNSPYPTLTQNRIKTNGSLPREKRSPMASSPPPMHMGIASPTGSIPLSPTASNIRAPTPSEDELNSIFSFEGDLGRSGSLTRSGNLCLYPPFPNAQSGLAGSPSPPPVTPRSPYENVSTYHGYAVPQSPRTRIRTTVGKDRREHCEIFENKMAISDFNGVGSAAAAAKERERDYRSSSRSSESITNHKENNFDLNEHRNCEVQAPPKPPRSPRIERGILGDSPPLGTFSTAKKDNNKTYNLTSDAGVIDNKYFVAVTPKSKSDKTYNGEFYREREHNNGGNSGDYSSFAIKSKLSNETSCNVDSKIKNKVFEEHMLKNIQDTLNIDDVAREIERLQVEKNEAIRATVDLKIKISELERQENESLRELEMERALLEGELSSTREKVAQEEEKLSLLMEKSKEMDARHREDRKKDLAAIDSCKTRLDDAEDELDSLEKRKESVSPISDEEKEILETLKAQHETVEAERKIFEDTEFSQMESEALRESEREELNKEIFDLKEKIKMRKEKISELEIQMSEMTATVCQETEILENERQDLITRVNKERMRVSAVDRQFGELARLGVMSSNGQVSPTCSSDTEESGTSELAERLAKLHLLDRSQDDLDRINQVTSSSPLDCYDSSLGRKTSATLIEIEKNRQLSLAKQGTLAIDNERKRVEELKRRVAHEVKAQWEEKKAREQREVNCASLNSVGSEDSSLTSSDLHTESLSSDDVVGQRSSGESVGRVTLKMRQRDLEASPSYTGEQSRPLSDASSFCDQEGQPVRFREKTKNQRPLTRYLPVRTEEHFDLRQHIESAGHQIELCPYLSLNQTSCRGYLHKLGSKFRTWQKRWFVFDRSKRALVYYSDKNEGKPKGGAYFQAIEEVYVDHHHGMKSPSPKLTFCVKTHERTYQLMAPSPEAMRIWIDVVFTGAEGYREFQGGT